jgi:TetR/AcrR family transcriptional regulator
MLRPSDPTAAGAEPAAVPKPAFEPPRRERNAAATQQRLLEAAEHEFAARGFAGARLRDIADAAGVQPALIHHYFVDKQGLYRAVFDRAMLQTSAESWKVLGTRRDLEGLVTGFVDVLVDFHATHKNFLALLRHEAVSGTTVPIEVTRERALPVLEAVITMIEARQAAGEVRADVAAREIVLATMSMAVHQFTDTGMLEALMPGCVPHDPEALAARKRAIVALVLGGIRPPLRSAS